MTEIVNAMLSYCVLLCCLNNHLILGKYWSLKTFISGSVWAGFLYLSDYVSYLVLRCNLLRQGSLVSLSKMTQTPESKSKAPPPTAEPNKHWGQAISATQRQALQYQSQPPLSPCTPQAWQVFSWATATVIWKVNNLYVTWLDWSFRPPQACYDFRTSTSAMRLMKIPGTGHIWGMEMSEKGEHVSGCFIKVFCNQRAKAWGTWGKWKWWRLLGMLVEGMFPTVGFGFEHIWETLNWALSAWPSCRKLRPSCCVLGSSVSWMRWWRQLGTSPMWWYLMKVVMGSKVSTIKNESWCSPVPTPQKKE